MTDLIERIDALTRNARNTWFALLSALLFVGVTLMGVEHIDFYGVDRATQLPLIGVSVPTPLFFYAAPLLTTAIYCYFHLYLIRLWDALGSAPARVNGTRLGDAITPWLLTDAALHLRRYFRGDNCTVPRAMEGASALVNFALSWGFGWVVLGYTWSQSLPARDLWMSQIAAASLILALIFGAASGVMAYRRLCRQLLSSEDNTHIIWSELPAISLVLLFISAALPALTWQKTSGSTAWLAALDLAGEELVVKPAGWLPYEIAREDFLAVWCKRQAHGCQSMREVPLAFEQEWTKRRQITLASLRRPSWAEPDTSIPDFRGADLSGTFLAGADLQGGQFDGANLALANLEGAHLLDAFFIGADLRQTELVNAQLQRSLLDGSDLRFANMTNASLQGAKLDRADMISARLTGTEFWGASMSKVDLSVSMISENEAFANNFFSADLRGSKNSGGAIRDADLKEFAFDTKTDWRNVFLDGSVDLPFKLRKRLGDPCQWNEMILEDEVYFALWRGWLEDWLPGSWITVAPDKWKYVTPIPPPEGCTWKSGPMPHWHGGGR